MGYGVDRGGGREAKGGSLRRSKKNPGAAAARAAKAVKHETEALPFSKAAPPLASPDLDVDCSVALLSRKLDATRERMVELATGSGCGAIIAWSADMDKQRTLCDLASDKPGVVYVAIGVHPDNVDRTNKKQHSEWLTSIEEIAKAPQCVAVLSGLNLSRDHSTHFAQESLLTDLCKLAVETLSLPLVIHVPVGDEESLDRALELVAQVIGTTAEFPMSKQVVLHNASGHIGASSDREALAKRIAESGVSCSVSAAGVCDRMDAEDESGKKKDDDDDTAADVDVAAARSATAACLRLIGPERCLMSTNSPWSTPQNLEDEYLRELPNEPCNLVPGVAVALASAFSEPVESFRTTLKKNAVSVFRLDGSISVQHETALRLRKEAEAKKADASGSDEEEDDDAEAENNKKVKSQAPPVASAAAGGDECESLISRPGASKAVSYSCVKCRAKLFTEDLLVTHSPDAPMHMKAMQGKGGKGKQQRLSGDDQLCDAALFLPSSMWEKTAEDGSGLVHVEPDGIECKGCGGKLGSIAADVPCLCGKVVSGSTGRIIASRVDRLEDLSHEELMERAAKEREAMMEKANAEEEASDDDDDDKKKKGPKKNVKKSNKSNLCNYRNKSTAAPKVVKVTSDSLADELKQLGMDTAGEKSKKKKKGKKGRGKRGDTDSDSD